MSDAHPFFRTSDGVLHVLQVSVRGGDHEREETACGLSVPFAGFEREIFRHEAPPADVCQACAQACGWGSP